MWDKGGYYQVNKRECHTCAQLWDTATKREAKISVRATMAASKKNEFPEKVIGKDIQRGRCGDKWILLTDTEREGDWNSCTG